MKRALQFLAIGLWALCVASSAFALPPPGGGDGGDDGGDDDGGDPPPDPEPPPPSSVIHYSTKNGAIGGSAVGADYQAALQVWTDGPRQNLLARGYASAYVTLLGNRANLAIINGMVTAGGTFGTEVSSYVLGSQVFSYEDSFSSAFQKNFSVIDWRQEFWSYTADWTLVGTGVRIRLAVDGGTSMSGSASAGFLYASGSVQPRVWVDAGGTLSAHLLWINIGSLSGVIHVVDATGSGNASIDLTPIFWGAPGTWSVSGMAQLCSGGGYLRGCIGGQCGYLAQWANYCPGWATLEGSTGGTI